MTHSFHRTRAILIAAVFILRKQPNLLWFPALAIMGIFAALLTGLVLMLLMGSASQLHFLTADDSPQRMQTVISMLVAFTIQAISVLSSIALSYAAMESLSGREWTLSEALYRSKVRFKVALQFALMNWFVGLLHRWNRASRAAKGPGLLHITWRAASYLAIPVITREGCEGFHAIRRSYQLVAQTWRESTIGTLVLKGLWLPLLAVVILPIGLLAAFEIEQDAIIFAVIATTFAVAGLGALIIQVIEAIYRAALYIFATEGIIPENYQCEELAELWSAKPKDVRSHGP